MNLVFELAPLHHGHHVCKEGETTVPTEYLTFSQNFRNACGYMKKMCAYDKRCGPMHGEAVQFDIRLTLG